MTKKMKIIGIVIILMGLGWWGYVKFIKAKPTNIQRQTAKVERGTLVIIVTASGQVTTANSAPVMTQISGVVNKVYVHNGQQVWTGTPIAQIDLDLSSRQRYSTALATYKTAQANLYTLQTTLFSTNQKLINDAVARGLVASDPTYIQENATWLAAEAVYKNQQNTINAAYRGLQLANPIIYAPIPGIISGLALQPGSVLAQSDTSVKIANIVTKATPTVTLNLTEVDIAKIKIGQKATLKFDAIPNKTFTGQVISVDTVGVVTSGVTSYPTIIKLDTSSEEIYANMSVTASIIIQTKDKVLLVPNSAVDHLPHDVQTGLASDTQTEIVSGLSEGDTVTTGTIRTSTSQTASPFSVFGNRRFGR